MPSLFTVTTTTSTLHLSKKRQGEVTFTVSNTSGRRVRGRALVQPEDPKGVDWLRLEGEAERDFPEAGTERYTVQINAPSDAPAGSYAFRLDMVGVERPDEDYTRGQTVTVEVPEAEPEPKPFPVWIVLVGLGALLLGGLVAFLLWPGDGTDTEQDVEASFRLVVEDVFSIAGRGTVVSGTVESGSLRTGDRIRILSAEEDRVKHETVITGVERGQSVVSEASAGERVGLLIRGIAQADVVAGDIVLGIPDNAEPSPEPVFDVILEAVGQNRTDVIREVHALTGASGLREVIELVDQAPVVVAEGLSSLEAREAAARLRGAGAEVQLEERR